MTRQGTVLEKSQVILPFQFHLFTFSLFPLHPQPIGLDGEEIETGCELKGLALRRTYG